MDFGVFEGKLHAELQDNPDYQAWLSSNCHLPCPGGEGLTDFSHRVRTTFLGILGEELARRSAMVRLVVHAGVIMALLAGLARPKRDFTAWQAGFCGGFLLRHQPAAGNRPLGLLARLEGRE
jgi:alpha-ribazole phosphatase